MRARRLAAGAGAVALVALASAAAVRRGHAPGAPRFAADSLVLPEGVERWILAGASLGLAYAEAGGTGRAGASRAFHNVYIEPGAYDHYVRTGRFREKTMFAMTLHAPMEKVSPSRQGLFEGDRLGVEMALKDSDRYPGGWAYFSFGSGRPGARAAPLPSAACQACHARHAADDHVFVQFYPTLRPLSAAYGRRRP